MLRIPLPPAVLEAHRKAIATNLLRALNENKEKSLLVVDQFAAESEKHCTRFLLPGVGYENAENYLSVFLGENHFEFLLIVSGALWWKKKEWQLLKFGAA